jgi:hypothetical protein
VGGVWTSKEDHVLFQRQAPGEGNG